MWTLPVSLSQKELLPAPPGYRGSLGARASKGKLPWGKGWPQCTLRRQGLRSKLWLRKTQRASRRTPAARKRMRPQHRPRPWGDFLRPKPTHLPLRHLQRLHLEKLWLLQPRENHLFRTAPSLQGASGLCQPREKQGPQQPKPRRVPWLAQGRTQRAAVKRSLTVKKRRQPR